MGGRDHACESCGRGGFNDPDGVCDCQPLEGGEEWPEDGGWTIWACPEPDCEEFDRQTWGNGRASQGCAYANHPKAVRVFGVPASAAPKALLERLAEELEEQASAAQGMRVKALETKDGISAACLHSGAAEAHRRDAQRLREEAEGLGLAEGAREMADDDEQLAEADMAAGAETLDDDKCERCGGSGAGSGHRGPCSACGGSGRKPPPAESQEGRRDPREEGTWPDSPSLGQEGEGR